MARLRRPGPLPEDKAMVAEVTRLSQSTPVDMNWRKSPVDNFFWTAVYGAVSLVVDQAAKSGKLPADLSPSLLAKVLTAIAVLETGETWRRRAQSTPEGDDWNLWNIRGEYGPIKSGKVADLVRLPAVVPVADGSIGRGGIGDDGKPKNGYFEAYPSIWHAAGRAVQYVAVNPASTDLLWWREPSLELQLQKLSKNYTPDAGWAHSIASIAAASGAP